MIPKRLHYCWFGRGKKSKLAMRCIDSWRKVLVGYEIIEWNEDNISFDECKYALEAYRNNKFAFVSDYIRLKVLSEFGGIYLDTDVEAIQSFEPFLKFSGFVCLESTGNIGMAVVGAEKGNNLISRLSKLYCERDFILPNGSYDQTPNTKYVYEFIKTYIGEDFEGKQILELKDLTVFPADFFSPKSFSTGEYRFTKNSVCVHHFSSSWLPWYTRLRISIGHMRRRLFR